jgi:hypothetical protein
MYHFIKNIDKGNKDKREETTNSWMKIYGKGFVSLRI